MSFITIIPARLASSRLPNKALLDIGGKAMVVRTAEQAQLSASKRVIVATDCTEIAAVAQEAGFEALLTHADHPTGTDRLSEVVQKLNIPDEEIIVNVQGDEPLIDPALINHVAQTLRAAIEASIATVGVPIADPELLFNPNVVKVVCDQAQYALYFSRAPIPWDRDALADGKQNFSIDTFPALQHVGLYAYKASFLRQFPKLTRGKLESVESLEQLRALEHGFRIAVTTSHFPPAPGVDTAEDLAKVREIVINRL